MNTEPNNETNANSSDLKPLSAQNEVEGRSGAATEVQTRTPIPNHRSPVVPLPVEPWPEPVDGQLLLDELRRAFERFVVLPKFAPEALALWTLHTYAFQLREVSAYLGIESPVKRCGKTTLLSVLDKLAHRPVLAANISFKAFFHVIEQARPTLLIDETDTFLPANDELRGILNAGYHRGTAFVIRFAQPGELAPEQWEDREHRGFKSSKIKSFLRSTRRASGNPSASALSRFSCWCPKAMAAIGRLPDTLADRCIVIRMQRKTANEKCERLRNLESATLTRQCARFVLDRQEAIAAARPGIPSALNDRAADIWEPLLVLADLAGGPWADAARQAAVALSGATDAQDPDSPVEALLYDILICFAQRNTQRMLSRELAQRLNELARLARPWRQILKGKEVTELWLSRILRPYGVHPKCFRYGDSSGRGYFFEDFAEIFQRYTTTTESETVEAPTTTDGNAPAETPSQESSTSA